jgi:hypothetical protein
MRRTCDLLAATPVEALWTLSRSSRPRDDRRPHPAAGQPAGRQCLTFRVAGTATGQLKALLDRCPELQVACCHIHTLAAMLTQLTGQNLPPWISDLVGELVSEAAAAVQNVASVAGAGDETGCVEHL